MFQLEVKIVIVSIGTKSDLLDHDFHGLCLDLFLFLLLLVLEFGVVNDLTNRWVCVWRNLHQIQILLLSKANGLLDGINIYFNVFSYHAYALSSDPLVDTIWFLRLLGAPTHRSAKTSPGSVCVGVNN